MNSTQLSRPVRFNVTPLAVTVAGLSALLLTGCGHRPIVVQTPAPTVIHETTSEPAPAPAAATPAPTPVIVVNQPPPAPLQDTSSPQPSPQYVWISGYWAWRNNQQQWVAGHWELPPHSGATWVPARWEQRGSEYVFSEGYWQ